MPEGVTMFPSPIIGGRGRPKRKHAPGRQRWRHSSAATLRENNPADGQSAPRVTVNDLPDTLYPLSRPQTFPADAKSRPEPASKIASEWL